ncbi:MAG TPA: PAS domain-containing protein, partial [Methylococcaceae bacterium]|nr:PAS domain-containing protein [Methylococcaceae bacterium]
MHNHANPLIPRAESCSRFLSFLTTLIGCAALAGWLFHIPWLTGAGHGAPTVVPITAACLVFAGLALWALRAGHARFVYVAAGVVGLTGLLTLAEYGFGLDPGIDRLLMEAPPEPAQSEFPGRMSRATALNFLLAGIGLLLMGLRRTGSVAAAQWPALLLLLSALFSLIGHLYGVQALRTFAPYQSMGLYTAVAFLALSVGLLLVFPRLGFMGVLASNREGGTMARRSLPLITGVAVFLGWLRLEGQQAGFYGTEIGLTLFALANIAVLSVLVFRHARRLNRLDREQAATYAALETKQAQLIDAQRIAHLGHWEWDIHAGILAWSEEMYRIFGFTAEEFVPRIETVLARTHPEDREGLERDIQRALLSGNSYRNDHRILRPDGTERTVHCQGYAVLDRTGATMRLFGTMQDITERVRSEEALRQSEARFRWLFDCDMIGIGFWRAEGGVADANDALLQLLGYTREDLAAGRLDWRKLTPPEYLHLDEHALQEIAERGAITPFEKEYFHKNGRRIPVLIGAATDIDAPDRGAFFVLDLSQRKEAEAHARRMAVMATLADERERKILARDLHDGLGQLLHVAKVKLDALANCEPQADCSSHLRVLQEVIASASRRVRSLTAQLVPPVLETFGLMPALAWLAEEMERAYGLAVEIDNDGALKPVNSVQAAILFRAVRELLVNVAKHAGVQDVQVLVRSDDGCLNLTVEDHGVGMAGLAETLRSKEGYGLASVLDRIRYLGGTLEICRPPAGGTAVTLRVPFVPSLAPPPP